MAERGPESGKDEQYQAPQIEGAPINKQPTAEQVVEPVESVPVNNPARTTEKVKAEESVTSLDVETILSSNQVAKAEDTEIAMKQIFLETSEEEISKDVA